MAFETARSMPGSQQDSYQGSTIWSCGKATLRRRIPGSLHRQSSTFEGSSPPTTRTIQRSRRQHPSLSIQPHQWRGPRRLQRRNVVDLLSPSPSLSGQKSLRPLYCLIFSGFPSPSPVRVGRFFTKHTQDLSVFFLSIPLGQEVFHQSILYLPYRPLGAKNMIPRNLVFLPNLPTCRQEVFSPIPQIKYQMTLIEHTLNRACA